VELRDHGIHVACAYSVKTNPEERMLATALRYGFLAETISDDEVLTFAVSDASGIYLTVAPVPAGKTFSVVVIAQGYRPILADDGLKIPSNASNPFKINATMRPNR